MLGALGVGAGVALSDAERRVRLERQARVWRLSTRRSIAWGVTKVRGSRASDERRALSNRDASTHESNASAARLIRVQSDTLEENRTTDPLAPSTGKAAEIVVLRP